MNSCIPAFSRRHLASLITNGLLKIVLPVYLVFALNVMKNILKYCSSEVPRLMLFSLKLRRNWKWKNEYLEEMVFAE